MRHGTDALVSLFNQLTQFLNCAILFHDVDLHDLLGLVLLGSLAQIVRLVSLLSLLQFIDFTLHVIVLLNGITYMLLYFLTSLLNLLGHLVAQPSLKLGLLLHQSLLLADGISQLGLQLLILHVHIDIFFFKMLDTIVLHHEGAHLRSRTHENIVVLVYLLHLDLDSKGVVTCVLAFSI